MTSRMGTVIYPVTDIARAKALFRALLGAEPVMDEAYYVQFDVGGQQIGLDPQGHAKGMTGPVGYWAVDDIQETLGLLREAGWEEQQGIRDVGGGKLVASVRDGDGNIVGLTQ